MPTVDSVLAKAFNLPVADRIRLIEALCDTIPGYHAMSLSPEWLAEIERRSAEFDTDQATGVSWEEVKAASLKRLAQDGLPRQTEE